MKEIDEFFCSIVQQSFTNKFESVQGGEIQFQCKSDWNDKSVTNMKKKCVHESKREEKCEWNNEFICITCWLMST